MPLAAHFDRERLAAAMPSWLAVALVLMLAWQVARLFWMLAVPPAPWGTPSAPPETGALRSDAFHPTAGTADGTPPQASAGGYRLLGVRAAIDGRPDSASAILAGPGGTQAAYRIGDALDGGARLLEVGRDYVRLQVGGRAQRLDMARPSDAAPPRSTPAAPAPAARVAAPAVPAPASTSNVAPADLLSAAGLRADLEGGYALTPRGDGGMFRKAGLQPGDVLVAIDGQPLDLERLRGLESELGARQNAELTIRRGDQTRTLLLQADPP